MYYFLMIFFEAEWHNAAVLLLIWMIRNGIFLNFLPFFGPVMKMKRKSIIVSLYLSLKDSVLQDRI